MNEKFNKNAKVEQLTKVVLSHGEENGLIVKDPLLVINDFDHLIKRSMFKLFSFLTFIQGVNVHAFYKFALIFIHR